jgi:hypothetical protein
MPDQTLTILGITIPAILALIGLYYGWNRQRRKLAIGQTSIEIVKTDPELDTKSVISIVLRNDGYQPYEISDAYLISKYGEVFGKSQVGFINTWRTVFSGKEIVELPFTIEPSRSIKIIFDYGLMTETLHKNDARKLNALETGEIAFSMETIE